MNSFARMTKLNKTPKKRRELTPDERAAATRFEWLIDNSEFSRSQLAEQLGLIEANIGHWAGGFYPIPLKHVARVARILKADPSEISPKWRDQIAPLLDSELRNEAVQHDEYRTDSALQSLRKTSGAPHFPIHNSVTSGSSLMRPDPVMLSKADYWTGMQEAVEGPLFGLDRWNRIADLYARIAAAGEFTPEMERELLSESRAKLVGPQGAKKDERAVSGKGERQ